MCPCHANSECLDMPHQKSAVCGQHHNIFSARVKTYLVHRTRVTMPSPQPWTAALSEKKIVVRNLLLPRVTFLNLYLITPVCYFESSPTRARRVQWKATSVKQKICVCDDAPDENSGSIQPWNPEFR